MPADVDPGPPEVRILDLVILSGGGGGGGAEKIQVRDV